MNVLTTLSDFKEMSEKYNFLPVYGSIIGDKETPVSIFEKVIGDKIGFLLESAEANKNFGRYSFLGLNPLFQMKPYKSSSKIDYSDGSKKVILKNPIDSLREVIGFYNAPDIEGLPPFCGGMIGYIAYDAVGTWENIKGLDIDDNDVLSEMMLCQDVLIMDHLKHMVYVITWTNVKDDAESNYKNAIERLRMLEQEIKNQEKELTKHEEKYGNGVVFQPDGNIYCENVRKIKEYIESGEATQIVCSQAYKRLLPCSAFSVYRRLRMTNPSPYMFYLNFGFKKVVGSSPEMLVRVSDNIVATYPIAGTRARGKTSLEDSLLAKELLEDKKELSEHDMLVDLGIYDIGKVSKEGTVSVVKSRSIEYFSHVMHIVSEIHGELSENKDAFDALKACFPAGTVSGAPKVRSMEIIAELEKTKRGVYAGAVGYWDFRGNMDACIAIRTMSVDGNVATVQGGAGIVEGSQPEKELNEVVQKTMVLLDILDRENSDID